MCRMLTFVTRAPATVAQVVTAEALASFTDFSHEHKDGWGIGWRDGNGQIQVVRGAGEAWQEVSYQQTVDANSSDQLLIHLRKASPGLAVQLSNCHPFTQEPLTFCHNGGFHVSEGLRASVAQRGGRPCQGTTDSELYFALVLLHGRELSWPDAIFAAVQEISADVLREVGYLPEALNCFLITPHATFAYSQYNPDQLKPETDRDYYLLQLARHDGQVVIASQGWPLPGGELQPVQRVLQVDRDTLRVSTHEPVVLG